MTREEVLDALKQNINETIGVDSATIDPNKTLKETGANSLDIVEIVSRTMRKLKVKIPRSELNKLKNINDLVDLLHRNLKS